MENKWWGSWKTQFIPALWGPSRQTVQWAPGPGLMGLHQRLTLRRGERSATSHDGQALQSFQRAASEAHAPSREDAKASPADSRNAEGACLVTTPLVPFLGKLWNTPCLECIQNAVSDIRNNQTSCSLDIPRFCELLSLPLTQPSGLLCGQLSVLANFFPTQASEKTPFSLVARCTCSSAFGFNKGKQSTPPIVEAFFPGELDNPDGSLQLHSNYVIAKPLQNHGNHSAASYQLQLQPNVLRWLQPLNGWPVSKLSTKGHTMGFHLKHKDVAA